MFIVLLYRISPVVISCALTLIRTQSFYQLGLYLSNSLALVLNISSLASDTGIDLLLISLLLSEPVENTQFIQILSFPSFFFLRSTINCPGSAPTYVPPTTAGLSTRRRLLPLYGSLFNYCYVITII